MFGKKKAREKVEFDKDGFSLFQGSRLLCQSTWETLDKAVAYKVDMLTFDLVRIEFHSATGDMVYAIDDDVDGFWELMDYFKIIFPGSDQQWEEKVVKPAFEHQETVIYSDQ